MKWRRSETLILIGKLQPAVWRCNYHITLGGVLNTGQSDKDLDLYFIPLDNGERGNEHALTNLLNKHFGERTPIQGEAYREASFYSHKWKTSYKGKRVDIFVVRG